MKLAIALSFLAGVAIAIYAGVTSHATPSAVFLGLSAFTMVLVIGLLVRAARALVEEGAAETLQATGRRKKELEREKLTLLKALKELEFDHEVGKINDVDFRDIGSGYRARAMRVLRQLDEQGADYKELVEKELKARLGGKAQAAEEAKPEESKSEAKPEPEEAKPAAAKHSRCAECGTTNDGDAVFCKKCGKKVAA